MAWPPADVWQPCATEHWPAAPPLPSAPAVPDAHSSPDPTARSPAGGGPASSRVRLQLDLASGIAHDFNNLLTVIQASVENAKRMLPGDSPARVELAAAHDACVRGAQLVRRLLGDGAVREPIELQLNGLLREAAELLRRVIGPRVDVQFAPGHALWSICADPVEIWQVVFNLALNARDAMPTGGVLHLGASNRQLMVTTTTELARLQAGDYVALTVRDTGTGIDDATRSRMFEPYFTTKGTRGTGIGLATVARIVGGLGGGIRVEGAADRGAAIEVLLPRSTGAGS